MFFPGNPLNYPANANNPLKLYKTDRAPTTLDIDNFNIGDEWLDEATDAWYKLTDKSQGQATWCTLCSSGTDLESIITDSGVSPVFPDGANQFTFTGGTGVTTVGTANTITWNLTGSHVGDWCFTCPPVPANTAHWCWDCSLPGTEFRGITSGYSGTDWITRQAGLQTLSPSPSTIATIPIDANRNMTVKAYFVGSRSNHNEALSGEIVYGARRTGGAAIEMAPPVVNIMEDATPSASIDADVNGNNIRLIVQGTSTSWQWVVTYHYMSIKTNV